MWLEVESFKDRVASSWQEFQFEGTVSFNLGQKLKALKDIIWKWNKENVASLWGHKSLCLKRIEEVDLAEQQGYISGDLKVEREEVKRNYINWVRREESSWHEKSCIAWLKDGDCNSKSFHKVVNARAKANLISGWGK